MKVQRDLVVPRTWHGETRRCSLRHMDERLFLVWCRGGATYRLRKSMVGRWLPPTRREAQKPGFQCTVDSVRILFPAPLLTANFRLTIRLVREDRRQTPFLTRRQRTVVFIPVHKWPPQGRSQALSEPLIEAQLFYAVSQPSPPFAAQSCAERTPICCAVHTAQYCCPLAPYAPLLGM